MKDITQKDFFTKDERFADLMNGVCFGGRKVVKAEELISVPESVRKADEVTILERVCDVVKKQTVDGTAYAIYVLENQETVDYRMLVRIMLEESLGYDAQTKQMAEGHAEGREKKTLAAGEYLYGFHKTDRLTPIYTVVLYWGEKEWDGATSLRELVEIPEKDEELRKAMLSMLPDYKIKVYDLNREHDFTAFGTMLRTVFEFCSRQNDGIAMKEYMDTHREEVKSLDRESRFFLSKMLGMKKWEKAMGMKNMNKEEGKAEEDTDMCKAIEELIEMGRQEGREEMKEKIVLLEQEIERLKKQQGNAYKQAGRTFE